MADHQDTYAEGGNYRVVVGTDGVVHFRVWRRPDVSREVGAAFALEMVGIYEQLAAEPWTRVRGVVMDLTDASMTWGPVTERALGDMCIQMERAGRWLAFVTPPDMTSLMTASNLLKKHAPRCGRAFGSLANGFTWAGQRKRISV